MQITRPPADVSRVAVGDTTAAPTVRAVAVVIAMLLVTLVGVATPAHGGDVADAAAGRFIDHVNAERAQRGIQRLHRSPALDRIARAHTRDMARRDRMHHNPDLGDDVRNWQRLSENVGYGPSVSWLHTALMNSDGHRRNILDRRVSQVGVGVVIRDGVTWVTQVFREPRTTLERQLRDVGSRRVHASSIETLLTEAIASGCGSERYCPRRSVSRAQTATLLARAMERHPSVGDHFTDIGAAAAHWGNVNAIVEADVTSGCTASRFCPGAELTRAQMATFLAAALDLDPVAGNRFDDVSGTHERWINALARRGVTTGCGDGDFCPKTPVTRAQMATFLVRAFRM